MKTIYIAAMIATLQLFCITGMKAQTSQVKLNQVELMKQFLGTWKTEMVKDTIQIDEFAAFGKTVVGQITNSTNGKILQTVKELWGYDSKNDKIVFAEVSDSSPEIQLFAFWFTTKSMCEGVPYQDISNPGKAALKYKMEIKSTDEWVLKMLQNNKDAALLTFTRIKK
jgi:hypothetical protein